MSIQYWVLRGFVKAERLRGGGYKRQGSVQKQIDEDGMRHRIAFKHTFRHLNAPLFNAQCVIDAETPIFLSALHHTSYRS